MSLLRGHRRFTGAPIVIGALALLPVSARAQVRCETTVTGSAEAGGESWAPPLGRLVTLHADGISLREALARLESSARIRITYSADGLPLKRTVCIAGDSVRVGDLLTALLRGLAVAPVSAGDDLVVLAAIRPRPAAPAPVARPDSVVPLEPVIVDAPATDPARRELPVVPGVLESFQLTEQSGSLADAMNGAIPGVWIWNASSSGLLTQYASVRGATSFGMSAPKVYIDGIEVANPYLLTRIPADAIERIEVIRGPQGAALYGADAISGVTNIVTRHGAFERGAPRFRIRSRFGLSSTDYPAGSSLAQDHNLALQIGSDQRSAALNLSVGTEGDFIPGASSRHIGADGSLRFVGANSLITGTLHYADERTRSPLSPVLSDSVAGLSSLVSGGAGPAASTKPLDLHQFTAGARASWATGDHWTHTAVAGVDGYALSGEVSGFSAILSPADSALRAAGAGAVRGTVRMSSTASGAIGGGARGAFTFAAEHTMLRQFTDGAQAPPGTSRSSTGISAQADVALHDRFFLTGGLRLEHNGTLESSGIAALPMAGGSWIASSGPVGLKFRGAYGRGIRWPDLTAPQGYWEDLHEHLEHIQLGPEMQSGVEGGVDVTLGRSLLLQVTRFDQTASGLVQRVAIANGPQGGQNAGAEYGRQGEEGYGWGLASTIQSVGVITNRGWEMEASVRRGPLSLTGNLSLVDSRVRQLADGYTGDLQVGDRVLAVPARIWGLSAAWTATRWSLSLGAAAANDWINYDRIALARASSADTTGASVVGTELRSFWRKYDGVPRLRATFTRDLGRGLALVLSGENLLDRQIGEPDNITVLPGRTLTLGFRASF